MSEPTTKSTTTQTTEGRIPQTVAKQVRSRKVWDVALTIVLLILNWVAYVVGAFWALIVLAFTDYCPESCNVTAAAGVQGLVAVLLGAVLLIVTIGSIVLLVRRRRAWWLPTTGLVLIVVGWIVGFVFYTIYTQGG